MNIEEQQIYSPERRTMIYGRVSQLSNIVEEMRRNQAEGEGDAADIASRLIMVAIALRLLVIAKEEQRRLI